jgi:hypothetical protein
MALLIRDLGARRGGWPAPHPSRFTPVKHPVLIVQKAGWAPGPVRTCAKNLAPNGIRSLDRPARRPLKIVDLNNIKLIYYKYFPVVGIIYVIY